MKKIAYLILVLAVAAQGSAGADAPAESASVSVDETLLNQVNQLQALKQENPDAYRQLIDQKKTFVRQEIQRMGGEDTSQFRQFKEKRRQFRQSQLEFFREKRPEQFREFVQNRRTRFQEFQAKNPEAARRFTENHPRFRERTVRPFSRNRSDSNSDSASAPPRFQTGESKRSAVQPERSENRERNFPRREGHQRRRQVR